MSKLLNKKVLLILMTMVLLLSTACSNSTDTNSTDTSDNPSETKSNEKGWPQKTIQITVPYNAGGDTDLYCRTTAKYLEDVLGETIIVVNTSGASGMNAAHAVMDSKADGYNILFRHTASL